MGYHLFPMAQTNPGADSKAQHAADGFHDAEGRAALVLRDQVADHGLADGHHHLARRWWCGKGHGPGWGKDMVELMLDKH